MYATVRCRRRAPICLPPRFRCRWQCTRLSSSLYGEVQLDIRRTDGQGSGCRPLVMVNQANSPTCIDDRLRNSGQRLSRRAENAWCHGSPKPPLLSARRISTAMPKRSPAAEPQGRAATRRTRRRFVLSPKWWPEAGPQSRAGTGGRRCRLAASLRSTRRSPPHRGAGGNSLGTRHSSSTRPTCRALRPTRSSAWHSSSTAKSGLILPRARRRHRQPARSCRPNRPRREGAPRWAPALLSSPAAGQPEAPPTREPLIAWHTRQA